jgi:hypothetical protein
MVVFLLFLGGSFTSLTHSFNMITVNKAASIIWRGTGQFRPGHSAAGPGPTGGISWANTSFGYSSKDIYTMRESPQLPRELYQSIGTSLSPLDFSRLRRVCKAAALAAVTLQHRKLAFRYLEDVHRLHAVGHVSAVAPFETTPRALEWRGVPLHVRWRGQLRVAKQYYTYGHCVTPEIKMIARCLPGVYIQYRKHWLDTRRVALLVGLEYEIDDQIVVERDYPRSAAQMLEL